jgi:hypothetical protein
MFAKSDHMSPRPLENISLFLRERRMELPSPEAVCRSAVVALLFLLRSLLPLTAPNLYYLMAESLGHKDFSNRSQLLCGIPEGK